MEPVSTTVGMGLGKALGISAGGSLFSGLANLFTGQGMSRRQNKRMVDFWRMQNEYNHPTQQMARLKEAGLNPNLMYGQSASGATGTAGPVGKPDMVKPDFQNPIQNLTAYADVKQRNAQTNLLNTQNSVAIQDAALRSAQAASQRLQNVKTDAEARVWNQLQDTSLQIQESTLDTLKLETVKRKIENSTLKETQQWIVEEAYQKVAVLKAQRKNLEMGTALRQLESELKRSGLENAPFWARWIYRELGLENEKLFNDQGNLNR